MSTKNKLSNSLICLGNILMERGIISAGRWEKMLSGARDSDEALLDSLSAEGAGTEIELLDMLAKELKVPFIELAYYIVDPVLCRIIPAAIAFSHTILPLHRGKDFLTLAMADPTNTQAIEDIEFMLGLKVRPVLARSRDIVKLSEEVFKDYIIDENANNDSWYDSDEDEFGPEPTADSLASRLFNAVIQRLASNEADRIHIESKERELDIIEIKDGVSSRMAPGHGPLKVDSPDMRELAHHFVSKFKSISNPHFNADLLPQETGAVIKYQNKNRLLKLNFSDAEDGDGLVIDIHGDSRIK